MYARIGYYLQMVAAFLLLALTHYFASGFLPIADCDETFNFIEPIHYLLYGSGKQTWELCAQFALRSWFFSWLYAWPAVFVRSAASLSSADVYFFLRIFNGRIACLAELFFVYSVWSAFSGKAAMVTLLLLLVNYPIPHAAVSVLPTSFVMVCNFVVLGCWLRTRSWTAASLRIGAAASPASRARGSSQLTTPLAAASPSFLLPASPPPSRQVSWCVAMALFFSVLGGVTGWPFAGLVSVPIGLDLLVRFPRLTLLCMLASMSSVVAVGLWLDRTYYCRWTLSGLNVVLYNVFGGSDRGPDLFDVEPWFFFWKNLTLNFHLMFIAVLLAPVIVLCQQRKDTQDSLGSRQRTETIRRFTSADDVRGSAGSLAEAPFTATTTTTTTTASPTSPLLRSRAHTTVVTPERRSPLLGGTRHAHLTVSSPTGFPTPTHARGSGGGGCSRGRELLFMSPFFLWFAFWMCIAHKEERFMSPAYPFMVLAATRAICFAFFPDGDDQSREPPPTVLRAKAAAPNASTAPTDAAAPSRTSPTTTPITTTSAGLLGWRRAAGYAFLLAFFLISYSRAMAVYTYYSGPERVFYDWYPVLRAEARRRWEGKQAMAAAGVAFTQGTTVQQTQELNAYFTLCVGREWYRFPSSFFVDQRYTRYHFLNTSYFHGMLPVSFSTAGAGRERGFLTSSHGSTQQQQQQQHVGVTASESPRDGEGSCGCGAASVNDLNQEVYEQYVQDPQTQCDAVFDSLSPPTHVSADQYARERAERFLDTVFTRSLLNRTAMRAVLAAEGTAYRHVDDAYAVMDVDRTPLWCRVLYYPFGISKRCAAWRPLVLNAKA